MLICISISGLHSEASLSDVRIIFSRIKSQGFRLKQVLVLVKKTQVIT